MSRRPLTRAIFVVVYLLIVTLVIILALEVLVRLFNLAPPLTNQYKDYVVDPYLPFKYGEKHAHQQPVPEVTPR